MRKITSLLLASLGLLSVTGQANNSPSNEQMQAAEGVERYWVKVHCYVLIENHFHLVATTPEGNLSKWMHQLKTVYMVYFFHRHQHLERSQSSNG